MSVLDKILAQQARLAEEEAARSNITFRIPFYKMKGNRAHLRIMPPWTNEGIHAEEFWREVYQHWDIAEDGVPVLCPRKTPDIDSDECAYCDFADAIRANAAGDLQAMKLAKDIRPKRAFFITVIDMEDPEYTAKDVAAWKSEKECPFKAGDPKYQIFAAGITIFSAISNAIAINKRDITSLTKGHDIVLSKTSVPGQKYPKCDCTLMIDPTEAPVPPDFKSPDLESIGWLKDFKEQVKHLASGVGGDYPALVPGAVAALPSSSGSNLLADDDEFEDPNVFPSREEDDLQAQMMAALENNDD